MRELRVEEAGRYIPEPQTAAEVLEVIEDFASRMIDSRHVYEAKELWIVLTALRGPDDEDYGLKGVTTAPIRGAALPKLARVAGAIVNNKPVKTSGFGLELTHFHFHTIDAVNVLRRMGKEI